MYFKKIISKVTIVIVMLIMTLVSSNLNWGKNKWNGIIEADAKGYYAYLPAVFIYKDLNFGFFDQIEKEKYYSKDFYYDYRTEINGAVINKYYCGTSIMEAPFFLIAHFLSYLMSFEMDGYSMLYPILISIAALFYLFIGLVYLRNTLKAYHINEWQISITLFAAVFGTNLFYYTIGEPGASHIYSFAFISMFLFYSHRYFSSYQKKDILILGILLGLIILMRPINGLVIFILPFSARNVDAFKQGLNVLIKQKVSLMLSVCAFLCIASIQLIIYKISTGYYFVYAYGDEGFNFLTPHVFDILFSYKKGLFLYTPLFLLSLIGCLFLRKASKFEFYSLFGFFLLITYVFSSWWMWYYGGSFSSRVYVEYISIFMIPLAMAMNLIKPRLYNRLYMALIALLIVVCQIQTYQYRYYHIHWENMTKEKYWDVFMRIDKLIK